MIHRPIQLKNISLSFPHKTCFEGFTAQIHYGSRIAIIGRNGCGKSSLIKMLHGLIEPSSGEIKVPDDVVFGYVPQVIEEFDCLSGGERLSRALSVALADDPNILLLDEPTNHLDLRIRKTLMRWLAFYQSTLIAVSHDVELLRTRVDTLWHIDQGRINIFTGNYDHYLREREIIWSAAIERLSTLHKDLRNVRVAIQLQQKREAQGRRAIARENDRLKRRGMKQKGSQMSGRIRGRLNKIKNRIDDELRGFRLPEVIKPKFSLDAANMGSRTLVSIVDGSVGWDRPIVEHIGLSVAATARVALFGNNGSGKSTIVKAILGDPGVSKSGDWYLPRREEMGYLDQHYGTLDPRETVLATIQQVVPAWSHADIRRHLNDFLFRKNEEVNAFVSTLSGGEKARLSLAHIAARTPKLLVLDEISNNLDLETREHVIQVLKAYPGAMIIISHDEDFLRQVGVTSAHEVRDGSLLPLYDW